MTARSETDLKAAFDRALGAVVEYYNELLAELRAQIAEAQRLQHAAEEDCELARQMLSSRSAVR